MSPLKYLPSIGQEQEWYHRKQSSGGAELPHKIPSPASQQHFPFRWALASHQLFVSVGFISYMYDTSQGLTNATSAYFLSYLTVGEDHVSGRRRSGSWRKDGGLRCKSCVGRRGTVQVYKPLWDPAIRPHLICKPILSYSKQNLTTFKLPYSIPEFPPPLLNHTNPT
jgi:hypothetical protein